MWTPRSERRGWEARLLGPGVTGMRGGSDSGILREGAGLRTPRSKGGGAWGLESQVPKGAWMLGLSSARHPLPPRLTLACLAAQTTSPSSAAPSHLHGSPLTPQSPAAPSLPFPLPSSQTLTRPLPEAAPPKPLSLHLPRGCGRASRPRSSPAPNLATLAHLSSQWNPGGVAALSSSGPLTPSPQPPPPRIQKPGLPTPSSAFKNPVIQTHGCRLPRGPRSPGRGPTLLPFRRLTAPRLPRRREGSPGPAPGPTAAGCSPSSARLRRPTASPLPPRPRHPPPSSRLPQAPRPGSPPGTPRPSPFPRGPPPRPLPPPGPARPGFPLPRSWPRSRGKNSIQPGRRSGRGRAREGGRPGSVTQGGGKGQKGPGGSGPAALPPLPPSASLGRARLSGLGFSSPPPLLPSLLSVCLLVLCCSRCLLSVSLHRPSPHQGLLLSLPASFPSLRSDLPTHPPTGDSKVNQTHICPCRRSSQSDGGDRSRRRQFQSWVMGYDGGRGQRLWEPRAGGILSAGDSPKDRQRRQCLFLDLQKPGEVRSEWLRERGGSMGVPGRGYSLSRGPKAGKQR